MKKTALLVGLSLGLFFTTSCDDEDNNGLGSKRNLTLNIQGLEDLGSNYSYEGWIIVNGSPVSAGVFNVDENGNLSQTTFEMNSSDLDNATAYVLTIEPSPDNSPAPTDVHILAGDFSGNSANISVDHSSAIGTNFTDSMGKYILATPTDGGDATNELSGVWWLNPTGPAAGLTLPTLPNGWKYEGWAVINGTAVSTGTFTSVTGADNFSGFSGTVASVPAFPGEDFLMQAPSGLTFPTDLSGKKVVISVEPSPDNSPTPFLLKPLVGMVPSDANAHTLYEMNNNAEATNPQGIVTK